LLPSGRVMLIMGVVLVEESDHERPAVFAARTTARTHQ